MFGQRNVKKNVGRYLGTPFMKINYLKIIQFKSI